jgi:hypothetical protein
MLTTKRYESTGEGIVRLMKQHNVSKVTLISKYLCRCIKTTTRSIEYFDLRSFSWYDVTVNIYSNGYTEIHVFNNLKTKCDICAPAVQYCDELPKPIGFDNRYYFHGTMAYNHCTIEEAMQRILDVKDNPSWQICCSTRHLGPCGIIVKGDVIAVSNIDLCSDIDDNGRRYYDARHWRANSMVYSLKDIDNTKWHHNEIIVKDHYIAALWVSRDAPIAVITAIEDLAKKLNLRWMYV